MEAVAGEVENRSQSAPVACRTDPLFDPFVGQGRTARDVYVLQEGLPDNGEMVTKGISLVGNDEEFTLGVVKALLAIVYKRQDPIVDNRLVV